MALDLAAARLITLYWRTERAPGSWTPYNGKHVSVSAPSLAWPSDTRMPLGEPGVVGSASVVG